MKHRSLSHFIAHIKVHSVLVSVAVIAVCAVILSLLWINRNTHDTVATSNESIALSPTVVQSIEQIGEWEFLAIHDEELVTLHIVRSSARNISYVSTRVLCAWASTCARLKRDGSPLVATP